MQKVLRFANTTGPEVAATAGDRPLLDKVIKYYLYRLTWEEVREARDPRVGTVPPLIMFDVVGARMLTPTFRLLPGSTRATLPSEKK